MASKPIARAVFSDTVGGEPNGREPGIRLRQNEGGLVVHFLPDLSRPDEWQEVGSLAGRWDETDIRLLPEHAEPKAISVKDRPAIWSEACRMTVEILGKVTAGGDLTCLMAEEFKGLMYAIAEQRAYIRELEDRQAPR